MKRNKEAEDLIARIAAECGYSQEKLIEIATNFVKFGDYHRDDSEDYKNVSWKDWQEFWKYFTILTDIELPEDEYNQGAPFCDVPFSCSC